MTLQFTSAFLMNEANSGHVEKTCSCGNTFKVRKAHPVLDQCGSCVDHCSACGGSGQFVVGIVNDILDTRGVCYRCGGKGHQTVKDRKRNEYYDNHVRTVHP